MRETVLDAVVELLLRVGFDGISVRQVAAAAGVSVGAVQHHFPTKDAMLGAAMERTAEAVTADLRAAVAVPEPSVRLHAAARALLGARPDQRPATVLWIARLARAEVHPPTAADHAEQWGSVEELLRRLLTEAAPGFTPAEASAEAGVLLALLDGLAVAIAREPERMPPERGEALLAQHLDRLLSPGRAGPTPR